MQAQATFGEQYFRKNAQLIQTMRNGPMFEQAEENRDEEPSNVESSILPSFGIDIHNELSKMCSLFEFEECTERTICIGNVPNLYKSNEKVIADGTDLSVEEPRQSDAE